MASEEEARTQIATGYARALRGLLEHVTDVREWIEYAGSYSAGAATAAMALRKTWDAEYAAGVATLALTELVRLGYPDSTTYLERYR